MGTTPFSVPGDIFESMFAKELRAGEERPERRHSDIDKPVKKTRDQFVPDTNVPKKTYHGEQPLRDIANPTVGLPAFGHQTFFNAVGEPDAIHIRQIGNRVISAVASSGRRNEDLSIRPMVPDGVGPPISPGEVINRRSMMNIQDNILESIPDPDPSRGHRSDDGIRRRAVMNMQKDVLDIIGDPEKYE